MELHKDSANALSWLKLYKQVPFERLQRYCETTARGCMEDLACLLAAELEITVVAGPLVGYNVEFASPALGWLAHALRKHLVLAYTESSKGSKNPAVELFYTYGPRCPQSSLSCISVEELQNSQEPYSMICLEAAFQQVTNEQIMGLQQLLAPQGLLFDFDVPPIYLPPLDPPEPQPEPIEGFVWESCTTRLKVLSRAS